MTMANQGNDIAYDANSSGDVPQEEQETRYDETRIYNGGGTVPVGAFHSKSNDRFQKKGLRYHQNERGMKDGNQNIDNSGGDAVHVGAFHSRSNDQFHKKGLRSHRIEQGAQYGNAVHVGAFHSRSNDQFHKKGLRSHENEQGAQYGNRNNDVYCGGDSAHVGAFHSRSNDQFHKKGLRSHQNEQGTKHGNQNNDTSAGDLVQVGAFHSRLNDQFHKKGLRSHHKDNESDSPPLSVVSQLGAISSHSTKKLGEKKSTREERNLNNGSNNNNMANTTTNNNNCDISIASNTRAVRGLAKNACHKKQEAYETCQSLPTNGEKSLLVMEEGIVENVHPGAVRVKSIPKVLGEKKSAREQRTSGDVTWLTRSEGKGLHFGSIFSRLSELGRRNVQVQPHNLDQTVFVTHQTQPGSELLNNDRGTLWHRALLVEDNNTTMVEDNTLLQGGNEAFRSAAASEEDSESKAGVEKFKSVLMIGGTILLVAIIVATVVPLVVLGGGDNGDSDGIEPGDGTIPSIIDIDTQIVPGLPVSTWEAVMDPESPQHKAYSWITQDPNLDRYDDSRLRQRFSLATFYHALGGPHWESTTWLDYDEDECNWLNDPNKTCDEDGNIVLLNITKQRHFRGSLPAEMSLLTSLKGMDFSHNVLGRNLTEVFGNIFDHPAFEVLWCSKCRLSGTFPSELAQLPHATGLFLSENEITGELPSEIGHMSDLIALELGGNRLTGPIPSTLGNMQSLKALKLGGNQLSFIPSEIGKLSRIEYLDLCDNRFEQSIPSELGALGRLIELLLDVNSFHGAIPSALGRLTDLEILLLNKNNLSGSIPVEVTSLTNLKYFWLTRNQLTGSIPHSIGQMTNLVLLEFDENALTSTIPSELGLLRKLQKLWLHTNELSGSIPSEIASLPQLKVLSLNDNPFIVQELPEEFCPSPLEVFDMDWCSGASCCV